MTDLDRETDRSDPRKGSPSREGKKPWKVRMAGRLCAVFAIPLTCFYVGDVPRAFDYMLTGELPPKLNVLWLEHSIRPLYLSGKFSRKIVKGALPASALGLSTLLLLLGCTASLAGDRVAVSRFEAFAWTAVGALLLGTNVMTSWIVWKAFVFV